MGVKGISAIMSAVANRVRLAEDVIEICRVSNSACPEPVGEFADVAADIYAAA